MFAHAFALRCAEQNPPPWITGPLPVKEVKRQMFCLNRFLSLFQANEYQNEKEDEEGGEASEALGPPSQIIYHQENL